MKYKIPFIKPHFPSSNSIAKDYEKVVSSNWFTNFGPFETDFRKKLSNYLGEGIDGATVANATLGLDIAIRALLAPVREKQEVIMPSFTFIAGAEMLISHGFTPVYIDIDNETWQPSVEIAKSYLVENSDKVAGLLMCNVFGVGNPDVTEWEALAKEYSIPLIIDSAAGFGSKYMDDSHVGVRGDCEIFSFHATKPFAVGEGGFIATNNSTLAQKMRELSNFGFDASKKVSNVGTNAKMQELNAVIGLQQLEGFNERLASRQDSLRLYKKLLPSTGFSFQINDELSTVPFVSVRTPSATDAEKIIVKLQSNGVEARKYYKPLHSEEDISEYSKAGSSLSITESLYGSIISLPLHDSMQQEQIIQIVELIGQRDE